MALGTISMAWGTAGGWDGAGGVQSGLSPFVPPLPYLVRAEAGGPAPKVGGGHGDAELQDGEDEQDDGDAVPCELHGGKNKPQNISSAQEEETPQDRTSLTFWGKDFGVHLLPQVLSTAALALGMPRSHPDPPTSLFLRLIERNGHFQGVSHLPRYQPKIGQAHGTAAADGPRSGCHRPWGP